MCFASFENPKTYQPARKKNKHEKITKSMQMSHINDKALESTN
jgi:hypothetical protein